LLFFNLLVLFIRDQSAPFTRKDFTGIVCL
jgi:hypothetical protein